MEGEAKEALCAIPGLAAKGKMAPFVLLISDNNTKLSGRIDQDAFDMSPFFNSLDALGWEVIKVENGHDLETVYQKLETALEQSSANPKKPLCLWTKTVKGKGVESTEKSASGGHGYPLKPGKGELVGFLSELVEGELPQEFKQWAEEIDTAPTKNSSTASNIKSEKIQAGFPSSNKKGHGSRASGLFCDC